MTWTESLESAAQYVQTLVGSITGVRAAAASPRDQEAVFPASVCFPRAGRFENPSSGLIIGFHTLTLQLHYPRTELARAYDTVMPYLEKIAEKLIDAPTLNDTVEGLASDIAYTFGQMSYGGTETIGWQFEFTVKIVYSESS
jgi:hypothetical protein